MTQQTKPLADPWFGVEAIDTGLLRLREAHIDPFLAGNIWLLAGEGRSILIDSGTGIMPLRPLVSALARQPVAAVALNRFYDHAGGLYEFDERLAHEAERAAHESPSAETSVAADFVSDAMLRALPRPGYSTAGFALRPALLTRGLADGDIIDIGGRQIEVIHTPGVSAGSICLWEAASGKLFTGDTLYHGPDGRLPKPRDEVAYRRSLKRLAGLPVTCVHAGHFASFGRDVMDELVRTND